MNPDNIQIPAGSSSAEALWQQEIARGLHIPATLTVTRDSIERAIFDQSSGAQISPQALYTLYDAVTWLMHLPARRDSTWGACCVMLLCDFMSNVVRPTFGKAIPRPEHADLETSQRQTVALLSDRQQTQRPIDVAYLIREIFDQSYAYIPHGSAITRGMGEWLSCLRIPPHDESDDFCPVERMYCNTVARRLASREELLRIHDELLGQYGEMSPEAQRVIHIYSKLLYAVEFMIDHFTQVSDQD